MAGEGSCFRCEVVTTDTVVNLGPKKMAVKDLESEISSNSEFGRKLKEIERKVEELV